MMTWLGRVVYDRKKNAFNLRSIIRIISGESKPQEPPLVSRAIGDLCAEYLTNYDGEHEEDIDFIMSFFENFRMGTIDREISVFIDDVLFWMAAGPELFQL